MRPGLVLRRREPGCATAIRHRRAGLGRRRLGADERSSPMNVGTGGIGGDHGARGRRRPAGAGEAGRVPDRRVNRVGRRGAAVCRRRRGRPVRRAHRPSHTGGVPVNLGGLQPRGGPRRSGLPAGRRPQNDPGGSGRRGRLARIGDGGSLRDAVGSGSRRRIGRGALLVDGRGRCGRGRRRLSGRGPCRRGLGGRGLCRRGLCGRRRRGRCRLLRNGGRRGGCRGRRRGRRRVGRPRASGRKEGERVEIAVRIGGRAHAEMDVGNGLLGRA
jgi:hypothetical protein